MKKTFAVSLVGLLLAGLFCGCVAVSVGNKKEDKPPTIQQQLNDLDKARKSGAITQEQYDVQRTKLLQNQ